LHPNLKERVQGGSARQSRARPVRLVADKAVRASVRAQRQGPTQRLRQRRALPAVHATTRLCSSATHAQSNANVSQAGYRLRSGMYYNIILYFFFSILYCSRRVCVCKVLLFVYSLSNSKKTLELRKTTELRNNYQERGFLWYLIFIRQRFFFSAAAA
jgi:hypothetical protein